MATNVPKRITEKHQRLTEGVSVGVIASVYEERVIRRGRHGEHGAPQRSGGMGEAAGTQQENRYNFFLKGRGRSYQACGTALQLGPGPGLQVQAEHVQLGSILQTRTQRGEATHRRAG